MAFKFMAGFNLLICGTCCWWNNGNLKFFFLYNFIGFIDSWILIKLMDNFTDWYVVYIAAVSLQYRDFTMYRTLLDFIKKYLCVHCGLNINKTCLIYHNLIYMKENLWNCIKQRKERKFDAVITNKLFQFSPLHQTKYTVKNNEKKSLNCFNPLSMSFDSDYSVAIVFIL